MRDVRVLVPMSEGVVVQEREQLMFGPTPREVEHPDPNGPRKGLCSQTLRVSFRRCVHRPLFKRSFRKPNKAGTAIINDSHDEVLLPIFKGCERIRRGSIARYL